MDPNIFFMAEEPLRIDKETLKAFGSDTRVQILKRLQERQMTASELSKTLGKHVTTVTEHLEVLENKNLVQRIERPGRKWIYYKLTGTGEKFTAPASHNFIFGILGSVAAIFSGVLLISSQMLNTYNADAAMTAQTLAIETTEKAVAVPPQPDYLLPALILIVAGFGLFGYILYRRLRKMKNLGFLPLY